MASMEFAGFISIGKSLAAIIPSYHFGVDGWKAASRFSKSARISNQTFFLDTLCSILYK
jgi:hypothetical protein